MGRILLLGAGKRAAAGGAFTPASLPNLLLWYDFSDLATLFTDTGGTTPVTADGDLIALVNDKSGNGHHLSQGTSGNRPAYDLTSGVHSAQFDGVNDYLSRSASPPPMVGSGLSISAFAAVLPNNADPQDTATILGEFSNASNTPLYCPLSPIGSGATDKGIQFFNRTDAGSLTLTSVLGATKTVFDGVPHVVGLTDTLSATTQYIDGVAYNAATGYTGGARTLQNITLGGFNRTTVSTTYTGKIQQIVVVTGIIGSTDRDSLTTWLAAKNGATI